MSNPPINYNETSKTSNTDKRFQVLDVSWRSSDRPLKQTSFMEFSSHMAACSLRKNYTFTHKKNHLILQMQFA